jgi:rod shape-determining protein MreC
VIATGAGGGTNSKVVFLDRGSAAGVMRGMAVITPDGIVGKVLAAYPTASQVLLITDPTFAAGVISQKHRVRGTVRGQGHSACIVDYIQNEEQVERGEWFYTSGDDGVFPEGVPVGPVTATREGSPNKLVYLAPSGLQGGLEEVLIVLEGVHQPIPDSVTPAAEIHLQAPPASEGSAAPKPAPTVEPVMTTEADRLRTRYQKIGQAEGHKFGENLPGSKPADFNLNPEELAARAARAAAAAAAQKAGGDAPAGDETGQSATPPPAQPAGA